MIRERSIEVLRSLPGAISLHEFGSRVRGCRDAWSDIDVQVITEDVNVSIAGRGGPFRALAPVMVEWEIMRAPDAWAATVLFAEVSPFLHLDVGFSEPASAEKDALLDVSFHHWTQSPSAPGDGRQADWYAPRAGSVEHVVIGDLLSIVRYIKARRRGEDLRCWKFFSAIANRVLEATFRHAVDPTRRFGKSLSSHEHMLLRPALSGSDTSRLASMLLAGDAGGMDRSISMLGQELVRLGAELEDVSASYRICTDALVRWIDTALRDQDFNDAL